MAIVLKHQLEASERSADELEVELRRQHRGAMLCYEVEDQVRGVVDLHRDLNRDVERWQNVGETGGATADPEGHRIGKEWDASYRRLAAVFEKTSGLVQLSLRAGFTVEGRAEFDAAWRELHATVCFSWDRVAAGVAQICRGETRPLAEVEQQLSADGAR